MKWILGILMTLTYLAASAQDSPEPNAPGTVPTDFRFERPDETVDSLSHVVADGEPLLLLLYNPDCSHCMDTIELLRGIRLRVLAVCIDGDRQEWLASIQELPQEWIPAYDGGVIFEEDLYIFDAPPALYFIEEGKVKLKDATLDELGQYL